MLNPRKIKIMEYIKPNKAKHVYVIGIDFGHGETSADICPIQWDTNYSQLLIPESVEIFGNVPAIKSVLLVEKKGDKENLYIGQQAVSRFANPKFHTPDVDFSYYSYFKKSPSLMSDNDRNVMRIFMREVYLQIRRQRPELKDDNHLVYIACPSNPKKWSDNEVNEYAKIALEAGLPLAKVDDKNIGIIRESRAAFLKARSNPKYKSSIKEGILLIDFGSSTVDLTYYSSKFTDRPIDDGDECGASHVEIGITKDLESSSSLVREAMEEGLPSRTAILLTVRDAKEYFYTYDSEDMEVSLNLPKFTKGKVGKTVEHYYTSSEIQTILSQYVINVRKAFENYRDTYLVNKPIKLIFLTGGASRMDFIQQIAREVFDYQEDFYKETNPSLTISNGIALAGRADLRTYSMEQALLSSDVITNADIATSTTEKTSSAIADRVISETSDCYSAFASRGYDDNLNSLESDVKRKVNSIYASSYLNSAYSEVLKDVANSSVIPKINNIVKDYFPDFEIAGIKSTSSFSLSVNSDSINTLSSVITSSLNQIEEGLMEGLAKFIWNIGAGGFIAAEGVLINAGIGIINIFRNKKIDYVDIGEAVDDATFDFRDKSTKLSSTRRADVKNKFSENRSSYRNSIKYDIKSRLQSDSSLIKQINSKGRDEICRYIREQIQIARIMLN